MTREEAIKTMAQENFSQVECYDLGVYNTADKAYNFLERAIDFINTYGCNKEKFLASFLKEMNEREQQQPTKIKDTPIDMKEICRLKNGTRIANILYDGCWGNNFSVDIHCGKPKHSVHTIRDLLQVEEHEFMRHRQAGKKSWESLNEYINKIKKDYDITRSYQRD